MAGAVALVLTLAACGGGSSPPPPAPLPPVPPPVAPLVKISAASPYNASCNGTPQSGTLYLNAEVEPYVAVNPADPTNIIALWQQDRWSSGGAQALRAGASFDGGQNWSYSAVAYSACTGNALYARVSDPWITFTPNGAAFQIGLSFSGDIRQAGSSSALLVSRSRDGGLTWNAPVTLLASGADVFNDKEAITADPNDTTGSLVYAVWDQLDSSTHGSTWFSRTTDGGDNWETARIIYDPGATQNPKTSQTIGNQVQVLPSGDVLAFFTQIDGIGTGSSRSSFRMLRSTDHGATWPVASLVEVIPQELAIGARDPDTGAMIRDAAALPAVAVSPSGDLYVAFQDARFSGGQRDGVLLTVSHDGGLNWSAPVQVNGAPGVQAFVPTVAVRADGLIGVTYYDQRHNTADRSTLPTDYWLALSSNGLSWSDNFITGPFDMDLAPNANGVFVGDYQALQAVGDAFMPVFVQTNHDATGPTDVYTAVIRPSAVMAKSAAQLRPMQAQTPEPSAEFLMRVQENLDMLTGDERQPRARASRRSAR